jgi:lipopolysaccharide export system permease protein
MFLPIFVIALAMFVILLSLIDLFANLWRYLAYEAQLIDILKVAIFYIPKCVSFALPVSLLFAVAYAIGDLYARNELMVVFTSGVPLRRFTLPLILFGFILSFASFFFEDRVVIPTLKIKQDLSRLLLHQQRTGNNSDIVVKANAGRTIYSVDFYNDMDVSLNGLTIIERNSQGQLISLIRARRALWEGNSWVFENGYEYLWQEGNFRYQALDNSKRYSESPGTFKRNAVDVEELTAKEAALFVQDLKNAGLPFYGALADYYKRYAFATASFVVILLSVSVGGRFKKNILLMCLLSSLISAVLFYVAQMISMMMAKLGYLSPMAGAWAPVAIFLVVGLGSIRSART